MNWFSQARFGMFIHYGLYSLLERGEWVLNREGLPLDEYRRLKLRFKAEEFDAGALCDLAVRAGMTYVVFTTMHHDGFCLYDTELTDYNSVKACGRDLTREVIEAARARGLRVALYHSLNNWNVAPDAVLALEDAAAYEKFIAATHERLRDLVSRYHPIDVLWYDGWWPFDADGWRATAMNQMVKSLQPNLLVNGRNGLAGDFATPEGHLGAPQPWRPWEACITHNDHWGFHRGDHNWKSAGEIVAMLTTVAAGGGNLLLNVGPNGAGVVPESAVRILEEAGDWLGRHGECIFGTVPFSFDLQARGAHRGEWGHYGTFTARDHADGSGTFYLVSRAWVGEEARLNGLECRVRRVTLLGTDREFPFQQDGGVLTVKGLPSHAPDPIASVLKFECEDRPSMYLTGGMGVPRVPHPHYDPCPSDIAF